MALRNLARWAWELEGLALGEIPVTKAGTRGCLIVPPGGERRVHGVGLCLACPDGSRRPSWLEAPSSEKSPGERRMGVPQNCLFLYGMIEHTAE